MPVRSEPTGGSGGKGVARPPVIMEGLNFKQLVPWKKLATVGIGLIVTLVWIFGYGAGLIGEHIVSIGLGAILTIVALSFFWFFLQAIAWNLVLGADKVSFFSLLKIKIGGSGLNMLSPFTLVGGDPVRVDLLKKQGVEAGAGSLVIDRAIESLAIFLIVAVGLILGVAALDTLPAFIRWGVPAASLVVILFFIFRVKKSSSGPFSALCACPKSSPATKGQLAESDRLLSEFRRTRGGTFYQALLLHILAQGLKIGEIYVIGSVLLANFPVALAFALTGLLRPLKGLSSRFLPTGLGLLESSVVGAVVLVLGAAAGPAALALQLIRRLRAIGWIVIGLALAGNPFGMFLKK